MYYWRIGNFCRNKNFKIAKIGKNGNLTIHKYDKDSQNKELVGILESKNQLSRCQIICYKLWG